MIPIQDVVPTGRVPAATLALIGLNVLFFALDGTGLTPPPFAHVALTSLAVSSMFLWLFGDNVEARLGRLGYIAVYLGGGLVPGIGAVGAVTAVLGSYFVMLPQSRVLLLVPLPGVLVEVPAVVFLAGWGVLHLLQFVAAPRAIWMFTAAFLIGAVIARLMRPRVRW